MMWINVLILILSFIYVGGSASLEVEKSHASILVSLEEGLEGNANILAWNDANFKDISVWILCKDSEHTKLATLLPNVEPFEHESKDWDVIFKEFMVENESKSTSFGLIGEGSIPNKDLQGMSIDNALKSSNSPTVFLSRSHIYQMDGVWSTDLFLSQIWVNSKMLEMIPKIEYNNESLLDVISLIIKLDGIQIVDGTQYIGSITSIVKPVTENEYRISSADYSLDKIDDIVYIVNATWPPSYILDTVADENGLVITNNVNCGYLDMAVNFLTSVQKNSDSRVLFVAMDQVSFDFLDELTPGCVTMYPSGYEKKSIEAGYFGKEIFSSQVTVRPVILHSILEAGYSALWSDSDMFWLGNSLELIPESADAMFMIDGDKYPSLCSCFVYIRNNDLNIKMMNLWHENIINSGENAMDQPALQEPVKIVTELGLSVEYFDKEVFPNGKSFFNNPYEEGYLRKYHPKTKIVHDNYIIGHSKKKNRFIEYGYWNVDGIYFPEC